VQRSIADVCINDLYVESDTSMLCQMKVPLTGQLTPVLTPPVAAAVDADTGVEIDGSTNLMSQFTVSYAGAAPRPIITRIESECGECTTVASSGGMVACPPSARSIVDNTTPLVITFVGENFADGMQVSGACE
jgi:hypothetical protein